MSELVKYREEFGDIAAEVIERFIAKFPSLAPLREELGRVATEITELLVRKRMDYGDESLSRFGELGILVRAWDKICRLVHLLWDKHGAEPQNESVEDSWRDLAGYAILALHARRYGFAWTAGGSRQR